MPKVKCKLCQASVERDEAYRTNLQSFCDVEHYKTYFSAQQKKHAPKINNEWTAVSKSIVKLDGGRCRMCGTAYQLHVHHIRYRGEDDSTNEPENLITLCQQHHDLVHTDKKLYQPKLFALIKKRKNGSL